LSWQYHLSSCEVVPESTKRDRLTPLPLRV
jgi:hypothetical protein